MKPLKKTEKLIVFTIKTKSKAYFLKMLTHCPHKVLLRFTFSIGTLFFDKTCIGAEVCRPHPTNLCKVLPLRENFIG